MTVRNLSLNSTLNDEEEALFGHLIKSNTGGTSTEMLYHQDCRFGLHTNLSISEGSVVPLLEYLNKIGVKLIPPSVLHRFDGDDLQYLQQSYASFISGIDA